MEIEELYNTLRQQDIMIKKNEPMHKHTTFKIGGPAELFVEVENIEQLKYILKKIKNKNIKLTVIGNGSNILVSDKGIKGLVIKINIKEIKFIELEKNVTVTIGSGNKMGEIAQKLLKENIAGFEELSGIPGTIGGAVRMNAGAHGKEMKDLVSKVTVIDYNSNIKELSNEQLEFSYRNSIFTREKYIICNVTLNLHKGSKEEIKNKMNEYMVWRKEHQPLEYPSAGSTFKRGEDFITAKLIDDADLKGYKIGGAKISEKHAGFIVNAENATAKDVIQLIEYTKNQVFQKFGKKIELEIELIGEE